MLEEGRGGDFGVDKKPQPGWLSQGVVRSLLMSAD